MSNITRVRYTGDASTETRLIIDMSDKIYLLARQYAVLLALTGGKAVGADGQFSMTVPSKLRKKVAFSKKIEWIEDNLLAAYFTMNLGSTPITSSATTTLTITSSDELRIGDLFINKTALDVYTNKIASAEVILVTAVTSATQVEVTRNVGGTAIDTIGVSDNFQKIGNANAEHATKRSFLSTLKANKYNYMQIFREPFGISDTDKNCKLYGGADIDYERKKHGVEHTKEIERAMFFGKASAGTGSYGEKRASGGILSFVDSNNWQQVNTTLTEAVFMETFSEMVFAYGSKVKWFFHAPIYASAISRWARGKLQIQQADESKVYGIQITDLITPHGTLKCVPSGAFAEVDYTAGIAVDLEQINYRYVENRDTHLKTNIQDPSADGIEEEYITECGLEVHLPKTHAVITGTTVVSA